MFTFYHRKRGYSILSHCIMIVVTPNANPSPSQPYAHKRQCMCRLPNPIQPFPLYYTKAVRPCPSTDPSPKLLKH
ncbi:hypothetical protein VTL71DRAFT_5933 [Oculimacula yallundae]|uniref:Uncharacterized protein n=1 Tax=Oculimacula yallundae TaxID=86028 RepID=A0ABR4BYX4_9HELO